ncbi:MAG: gliding motility-associated C-terminal domain-containing protein [Flavobacteriaceae bacterium]|nr:gliding motility-associated C-terminal domain-containing protein [Flavobacteriaceae bacterium]
MAQPILGFEYACASPSFNQYNIEVISSEGGFETFNKFVIELSDATGNFDSPVILKEVASKNSVLNFETSFSFPTETYGKDYQIRVRSTHPESISPASVVFAAYYLSNTPLILENYKDVYLCDKTIVTLSLNTAEFSSYNWYLNGSYLLTAGASIEVKKEGLYYAEVDFGICSGGASISNLIRVTFMEPLDIQIHGESTVSMCSGDSYLLKSTITDLSNDYYWYKDGELIKGISTKAITYLLIGDQLFGDYTLEVVNMAGCVSVSEPVTVVNVNSTFTVTTIGQTENIIVFPGETATLEITTNATSYLVKWYKNNELLVAATSTSLLVSEEGIYKAVVSVVEGSCVIDVSSDDFKVYTPSNYFLEIETEASYASCISDSIKLQVATIHYEISTGEKLVLNVEDYSMFNYQWLFQGTTLSGENNPSMEVLSFENSGEYQLKIYDKNEISGGSNLLNVNLKLPNVALLGEALVYLCSDEEYTFEASIKNLDYTYTWYKNESEIKSLPPYSPMYTVDTDVYGEYRVEVKNQAGCTSSSNTVALLNAFVSFYVTAINSSAPIVVYSGETKTLEITTTATNPIIRWYKDGNEIPGATSLSLAVSTPGEYRAMVTVSESCTQSVYSDYFKVIIPENYKVTLIADTNYVSCESTAVTLKIEELVILQESGISVLVAIADYAKFSFSWSLNGTLIAGENEPTLVLDSWGDNGSYQLRIMDNSAITALSNDLLIKMKLAPVEIFSETPSATKCEESAIKLYTEEKEFYTYQWYLNSNPLTGETAVSMVAIEQGDYYLSVKRDNCTISSNSITVKFKGAASIHISPSESLFIKGGTSVDVVASGGESYQWKNEQGDILSETAMLSVSEEGKYAVVAKIGNCEFTKIVEVFFITSVLVPNIISPNGDGVNDTWNLPPSYAFNKSVEIIIYNANGAIVYKTKNYQNTWPQGTINNVPSYSLFYYVIKQEGQVFKKGTITIIK